MVIASVLFAAAAASIDLSACSTTVHNLDFIVLQGDAVVAAIEDDIRAELTKVNMVVTRRMMDKDSLNTNMTSGNFNMVLSETWGPPYDPHSFAASWLQPDEAHYAAFQGLKAPQDRAWLQGKINNVLTIENEVARQAAWTEILTATHAQAIDLPFFGKRIPAVFASRLSSYRNGLQQFDYPLHTLRVESGSTTITVAAGSQTGLFTGVGRLDAHSYRPNEFWANNLVYEGLVEYGANGQILPGLALSWTVADLASGGQRYTFNLRQGVKFHDGADWTCAVAKMNFDNVLASPLTTGDWHGWYNLPKNIASWSCVSASVLEVLTSSKYYPLLQELSYIRPLRMMSPNSFVGGTNNNPLTQNSCPVGWSSSGPITLNGVSVTCAGVLSIAGTGRWKYISTEDTTGTLVTQTGSADTKANVVTMDRFSTHWDGSSARQVEKIRFVSYATSAAVRTALVDGSLDAVVGDGVLDPTVVREFRDTRQVSHTVYLTEVIQNRLVILNANRAPTDDLEVRKAIIHAIDKAAIIEQELAGLATAVDSAFPKTAPYCDIDLTPRWDYDLQKTQLLLCDPVEDNDDSLAVGWIVLIVIASVVAVSAIVVIVYMVVREKQGKAIFAPIPMEDKDDVPGKAVSAPDAPYPSPVA